MKITKQGSVWVAEATYHERHALKAAGFWWHGSCSYAKCQACASGLGAVWWTFRPEVAEKLAEHADGPARAELTARGRSQEASRATDAAIDIPCPEGLAFYPFQKAGIAYALARKHTLIADEMGVGKSIQAIGVMNSTRPRSTLVICPASLRLNWRNECIKWSVPKRTISVIDSPEFNPADIVICNYDRLKVLPRDFIPDLLIIDESHFIKNPKAKRTQAVLAIAQKADRCLFMSGTPVLSRPIELQPILSVINPKKFGNFFTFAKRYCNAYENRFGWDFSGASNLDELQSALRAECMVRRLKKDVLKELPPKIRQLIVLPTDGHIKKLIKTEREYQEAAKGLETVRPGGIGGMAEIRQELALLKAPMVAEHVELCLEQIEKIVVFAHHHSALDFLARVLAEYGVVRIDGRTKLEDRQKAVEDFQNSDQYRVAILGIHAAGVGLTLTRASHVVFAELDWVPGNMNQAEDRCHRIGQANSVLVQHLVFDESLDANIAKMLIEKQNVADSALDKQHQFTPPKVTERELTKTSAIRAEQDDFVMPSQEVLDLAKQALQSVASECDGASSKDHIGFNKMDSEFGKSLAFSTEWSEKQAKHALRLCRKYRRQIPGEICAKLGIEE